MSKYSQRLKDCVMNYCNTEKEYGDIPFEMALPSKEFPIEQKSYPNDHILEDNFLLDFDNIREIIEEEHGLDKWIEKLEETT